LIANALTVRGVAVAHITSINRANPHHLTPFALVEGTRVTYPGEDPQLFPQLTGTHTSSSNVFFTQPRIVGGKAALPGGFATAK
jgi:hypothetical protein